MMTDHARMLPMSLEKKSCTWSCQVPFGFSPSNGDSGAFGVKLPVNGALAEGRVWMDGPALSSSSTVWQKLFPPPSGSFITSTEVALGERRVTCRSLTNVWSMPTVVAPTALLQLLPSIRRSTSRTLPLTAATSRLAMAGAPGLVPLRSAASGIGTTGPV